MLPLEIQKKLEELKNCEQVGIKTIEGTTFTINYVDIVNDIEQEVLFVKAPFGCNERIFLYCVIRSISSL